MPEVFGNVLYLPSEDAGQEPWGSTLCFSTLAAALGEEITIFAPKRWLLQKRFKNVDTRDEWTDEC